MTKKEFLKAMGETYDFSKKTMGSVDGYIFAAASHKNEKHTLHRGGVLDRRDVADMIYKLAFCMEIDFREHEQKTQG